MQQGYVIALSTIPPRFEQLQPVLTALLAQRPAPVRVILHLAKAYDRFPGPLGQPDVPDGVEVLRGPNLGPGSKAVIPARALSGQDLRLIYCDDDWIAGPGWAQALLSGSDPETAATGQGFDMYRLGRSTASLPSQCDIAQGFSGVSVQPDWLADATPPEEQAVRMADDIWLSGHLAAKGIPIRPVPAARAALTPAFSDGYGLQDLTIHNTNRDQANRKAVEWVNARFGIWPARGT